MPLHDAVGPVVLTLRPWTWVTAVYGTSCFVLGSAAALLALALDGGLVFVIGALLALLLLVEAVSVVRLVARPGSVRVEPGWLVLESPVLLRRPVRLPLTDVTSIWETTKRGAREGQARSTRPSLALIGPQRVLVVDFGSPVLVDGRRVGLPLWSNQDDMFVMSLPRSRATERGVIISMADEDCQSLLAHVRPWLSPSSAGSDHVPDPGDRT